MAKLLIIEDDPGLRSQLSWALSDDMEVLLAEDRETALATVRKESPPVVILDLGLPPDPNGASEGLATLESVLSFRPATKIIVASGNEDQQNAVKAVSLGAYDFYPKPVDIDVLKLIIGRALNLYKLEVLNRRLARTKQESPLAEIITGSAEMLKVCKMIERIASSVVNVLLIGESGTGKEILTRAIHTMSGRASGPFVAINCAAIPENLLESELFGHEKGAFTGAVKQTIGKIEQAHEGTLFLDEIGDMPLPLQAKLLRFLEDHIIERVGGRKRIDVDLRLVSATNQDLKELIQEGRFREDLYYRLDEVGIFVPPLRRREGDSVLLANFFLQKYKKKNSNRGLKGFTTDALAAIANYDWPGNVRELENRVKRAVVLAEGKLVTAVDLDFDSTDVQADFPTLKEARERAEIEIITTALAMSRNNVSAAAKLLGVSRPTLYDLMTQLNVRI